jgi:hypothetical protein
MAESRTPGFCALCKSRCGSILVARDGRFIGQEPNPEHPTGQSLCVKGRAAAEIVYNPQRQLYPLRRTNPKGAKDPGWQRISWNEAFEETGSELKRICREAGAEAVAFGLTTPSGTPISDNIDWIDRFVNAFGSPNLAYGTEICNWQKITRTLIPSDARLPRRISKIPAASCFGVIILAPLGWTTPRPQPPLAATVRASLSSIRGVPALPPAPINGCGYGLVAMAR